MDAVVRTMLDRLTTAEKKLAFDSLVDELDPDTALKAIMNAIESAKEVPPVQRKPRQPRKKAAPEPVTETF